MIIDILTSCTISGHELDHLSGLNVAVLLLTSETMAHCYRYDR